MADNNKVDEDKKLAASLLAVAVQKKNAPPPFPAVLLVSLWALVTAAIVLGSFALASVALPSSWSGEGPELTAAAAAEASANLNGALWCSAAEAAAAALALLLPDSRHRSRWALAYAALVATAVTHLMWTRATTLFVTAAGSYLWWMWIVGIADLFVWAAGDVVCFLALLCRLDDLSY